MLVVDASCLAEVVMGTPRAEPIRRRLQDDPDLLAPAIVDVEVLGVIRRRHLSEGLDGTAAALAVAELHDWPGERLHHRAFLRRAWELRFNLRGWDAMYVALAEATGAVLVTRDAHLAAASGPTCRVELIA